MSWPSTVVQSTEHPNTQPLHSTYTSPTREYCLLNSRFYPSTLPPVPTAATSFHSSSATFSTSKSFSFSEFRENQLPPETSKNKKNKSLSRTLTGSPERVPLFYTVFSFVVLLQVGVKDVVCCPGDLLPYLCVVMCSTFSLCGAFSHSVSLTGCHCTNEISGLAFSLWCFFSAAAFAAPSFTPQGGRGRWCETCKLFKKSTSTRGRHSRLQARKESVVLRRQRSVHQAR